MNSYVVPHIEVDDFARNYEFYTKCLGFSEAMTSFHSQHVVLIYEDIRIQLYATDTKSKETSRLQPIKLSLIVSTTKPILKQLEAKKIKLIEEAGYTWLDGENGDIIYAVYDFSIQDPAGNTLIIAEELNEEDRKSFGENTGKFRNLDPSFLKRSL